MITKQDVIDVVSEYDKKNITIGVLGSHSALDVCDGARDEGIPNLVVCQKGRDGLYTNYFKNRTVNGLQKGFVDETVAVSYTHLRAHETDSYLVCRLLLEKKKKQKYL